MEPTGIQQACDKMGGQVALAEALGVSQPAVSRWVGRGYAPRDRILRIAELTGVDTQRLADPRYLEAIRPR